MLRVGVFALLVLVGGMVGVPSAAVGQTLPRCPDEDESVTSEVPRFLREGASLAFSISRDSDSVADVEVVYPGPEGPLRERFAFPPEEDEIRVIRPAPPGTSFALTFTWQQGLGSPNACGGTDAYTNIPIVASSARVGRPESARLTGRYRATYTRQSPSRWTLRPSCDVFGCATKLRSNGGLRGTLRPQSDGTYEFERRTKVGECRIASSDGSRKTWRIFGYDRVTLRVRTVRERDGVALQLVGRKSYYESAPSDEFDLCNVPENRFTTRLTVRRTGD